MKRHERAWVSMRETGEGENNQNTLYICTTLSKTHSPFIFKIYSSPINELTTIPWAHCFQHNRNKSGVTG